VSTTRVGSTSAVRAARALDSAQVAWLAALPCALLTVLAVALLGAPVGHAFFAPGSETFWPKVPVRVEPVEHARYVLALLGPAALVAAVVIGARRPLRLSDAVARAAVLSAQLVLLAFVVLCFLAQRDVVLGTSHPAWQRADYFTLPTLVVGALVPALALLLMRRGSIAAHAASLLRETPARRFGALALALLFLAAWVLSAVTTDGSIATTNVDVGIHLLWSLAEPFAILNGHTPLATSTPSTASSCRTSQPPRWRSSAARSASSASRWRSACAHADRRLRAAAAARPFVRARAAAVGAVRRDRLLHEDRTARRPLRPRQPLQLWPIRYGGPYVLAWLLVRHVDRAAPRRAWLLFLFAGLTVVNNPDFGLPALAALVVALALASPPRSRRALGRLASPRRPAGCSRRSRS
jgi:hypothetical protein